MYLIEIGRLLVIMGDLRQAVMSWQTALIHQPDLSEAHSRLLDLRLEMARLYDRPGDWTAVHDGAAAYLDSQAQLTASAEARIRNADGVAQIRLARVGDGGAESGEADVGESRMRQRMFPKSLKRILGRLRMPRRRVAAFAVILLLSFVVYSSTFVVSYGELLRAADPLARTDVARLTTVQVQRVHGSCATPVRRARSRPNAAWWCRSRAAGTARGGTRTPRVA